MFIVVGKLLHITNHNIIILTYIMIIVNYSILIVLKSLILQDFYPYIYFLVVFLFFKIVLKKKFKMILKKHNR